MTVFGPLLAFVGRFQKGENSSMNRNSPTTFNLVCDLTVCGESVNDDDICNMQTREVKDMILIILVP